MKICFLISILGFVLHSPALACASGEESVASFSRHVADANRIFLGQVVASNFSGGRLNYTLLVSEWIKADEADRSESTVQLEFVSEHPGKGLSLGDHSKIGFWSGKLSGTPRSSDCTFTPNLRIGAQYLIFENSKATRYDYEMISTMDDHWLNYVRILASGAQKFPFESESLVMGESGYTLFDCKDARRSEMGGNKMLTNALNMCANSDSLIWIPNSILGENVVLPVKNGVAFGKLSPLFLLKED